MTYDTWSYFPGFIKFYTDNHEISSQVASWKGCKRSCSYYTPSRGVYATDMILPSKLKKKLAKLIKGVVLSTAKSQNKPVEAR